MKKIEHLLNLEEQRIVLLGGIPGAGKSTLSKRFKEVGYEIVSPDEERLLLAQKEFVEFNERQDGEVLEKYSKQAWINAKIKFDKLISKKKSILFDATLTTKKQRRQVKSWLDGKSLEAISIYLDVEVETAIERNLKRSSTTVDNGTTKPSFGRFVPTYVIEHKNRYQSLPSKEEGFKEIIVLTEFKERKLDFNFNDILDLLIDNVRDNVTSFKEFGTLKEIFPHLNECWGVSQDNKHHNKTLDDHMISAAEILVEKYKDSVPLEKLRVLLLATLNHDVGKKATKEFYGVMLENYNELEKNEKVIILGKNEVGVIVQRQLFKGYLKIIVPYSHIKLDPNAHFYGHDTLGALKMRRNLLEIGANEDLADEVYFLILYHMLLPYEVPSNKATRKIIRSVGRERIDDLLKIRYADKMSSNTSENFTNNFESMKQHFDSFLNNKGGKQHE